MTPAQMAAAYVCAWLLVQAFVIAVFPTAIDLLRSSRRPMAAGAVFRACDRFTGAVLFVGLAVVQAGLLVLAKRFALSLWSPTP